MAWDWLKAADSFKRCRNKFNGRLIAKNTYLKPCGRDDKGEHIYQLTYCNTALVRWHSDGTIQVRTAGWDTNTTRRRITYFAGVISGKVTTRRGETIRLFDNYRVDASRHACQTLDESEWVTLHRDENRNTFWMGKDGTPLQGRLEVVDDRKRSPKRNPLSKMCRGDVFVNDSGKAYIALNGGAGRLRLVRYHGDPRPDLCRIEYLDSITVTEIFALSMQAGGWTVGERFEGGM